MPRILLVEDDPDIQLVLRLLLEAAGYEVTAVSSGADALRLHGGHDLMLLDLRLPDIGGEEVLRRLPEPWPLPVVVVSAHADRRTARALMDAGCAAYLTKPFDRASLLETVAGVLGRSVELAG